VNSTKRLSSAAGFSLVDMLVTVTLVSIVAGMAVASLRNMTETMRLGQGAREVERELQTARLKAVTSNRPIRVRFNCPTAGSYRMVEVIGSSTIPAEADGATNRCQETVYPYPANDRNALTVPNHDGPMRKLHPSLSFGSGTKNLEFEPNGTVKQDDGSAGGWPRLASTGTEIVIVKGSSVKKITVNNVGKIQIAQ
jgi:Tfp pilus assembly protein FimT